MSYRYSEYAAAARKRLLAMLASGEIKPLVEAGHFAGLVSVADAVEHLPDGRNIGNVVVDLRSINRSS